MTEGKKNKHSAKITILMIFLISAVAAAYTVSYRLKLERLIQEGKIVPPPNANENPLERPSINPPNNQPPNNQGQKPAGKPTSFRLESDREGFIEAGVLTPVVITIDPLSAFFRCEGELSVKVRGDGDITISGDTAYQNTGCGPATLQVNVSLPPESTAYAVADVAYLSEGKTIRGTKSVMFTTAETSSQSDPLSASIVSASVDGKERRLAPVTK